MLLSRLRVHGIGPLGDLTFDFAAPSSEGRPRSATVVLGGAGVGKTSLLAAIASTRPGHALAQPRRASVSPTDPPHAIADWLAGDDDPARPHALTIATPNATLPGEEEDASLQRRREQAFFDRRATEGGFVLVALSGARWFGRAALHLSAPERTLSRWDVRAPSSFDDATRADLSRETKQVLAYSAIGAALAGETVSAAARAMAAFDRAVRGAVDELVRPAGYAYLGAAPSSLEPLFSGPEGAAVAFDDLPTGVRHLVAFGALPVRALFAAYAAGAPGRARDDADARMSEGVVLIDDADAHLDLAVQRTLVPSLRAALPRVQWIVTTASPAIAYGCDASEVLALRRLPASPSVELFDGDLARLH
jgi:hypothetical protein